MKHLKNNKNIKYKGYLVDEIGKIFMFLLKTWERCLTKVSSQSSSCLQVYKGSKFDSYLIRYRAGLVFRYSEWQETGSLYNKMGRQPTKFSGA